MTKRRQRRLGLPDTPEVQALILAELEHDTRTFQAAREALETAEAAMQQAEAHLNQVLDALRAESMNPSTPERPQDGDGVMDFEILCQHDLDVEADDYHPLDRRGIEDMLTLAQRHSGDAAIVSKVQVRLGQAISGMRCPRPIDGDVADRLAMLDSLFVERFHEGARDLVERLARIIGI